MTTPRRSGWPPTGTTPRPHSVAALAHELGIDPADTARLARALGIGRRWIRRYRAVGLTDRQAEAWATRVGLHPLEVWPDWGDTELDELEELEEAL